MIKLLKYFVLILMTCNLFALHGKIVFYDGTYVMGKVTKVDESMVYIIPIGLDSPEGVLVGNIDSLNMENGMVPVLNSAVEYFYERGEFIANNDDWMDEYENNNLAFNNSPDALENFISQEDVKSNRSYYNFSVSGGVPLFAANSLQEQPDSLGNGGGTFNLSPNFGVSFQTPYFQFGPVDYSMGFNAMNYSFSASHQGLIEAIQLSGFVSLDLKPVLFFLPKNFHLTIEGGPTFNFGYDVDQNINDYPNIDFPKGDTEFEPNYAGIGANSGLSIQYWLSELPIAFNLFFKGHIIPQAPPFTDVQTFYGSSGVSLIVILKRSTRNNKI